MSFTPAASLRYPQGEAEALCLRRGGAPLAFPLRGRWPRRACPTRTDEGRFSFCRSHSGRSHRLPAESHAPHQSRGAAPRQLPPRGKPRRLRARTLRGEAHPLDIPRGAWYITCTKTPQAICPMHLSGDSGLSAALFLCPYASSSETICSSSRFVISPFL